MFVNIIIVIHILIINKVLERHRQQLVLEKGKGKGKWKRDMVGDEQVLIIILFIISLLLS